MKVTIGGQRRFVGVWARVPLYPTAWRRWTLPLCCHRNPSQLERVFSLFNIRHGQRKEKTFVRDAQKKVHSINLPSSSSSPSTTTTTTTSRHGLPLQPPLLRRPPRVHHPPPPPPRRLSRIILLHLHPQRPRKGPITNVQHFTI